MMRNQRSFILVLLLLLIVTVILAIAIGAVHISLSDMMAACRHIFRNKEIASIREHVFLQLRLPRVLLTCITGAILAVSGVLMQGLFRNPIVEPGLVGTSSGAAFGASVVFVLAAGWSPSLKEMAGPLLVPIFAFGGALLATWLVYTLSKSAKHVSIITLLLTGVAINAVCLSGTGFMSYIARDPQARSITFWNLGTFSGATWTQVLLTASVAAIVFLFSLRYGKQLNAMLLGEEEAGYLGVDTERLKKIIMIINTAMVAVATSFVGVISFVGLVVPHMMRSLIGSDSRKLLPASMITGAILLTVADLLARILIAPAEIPVGIITSLTGAPVFIFLLKRMHVLQQKGGGYA